MIAEENNLYGTGVNVAVRLEQLAKPGGICLSQTVYDQVRKIVEIPFEDIGEHRLKNIAEPVQSIVSFRTLAAVAKEAIFAHEYPRQRFSVATGVLLLLLAVAAAGAFYLRQPAVLWDALLGGGVSLPEHAAIAVLPFNDMSATHDQQYLADGITEELTTGLAKFPELIVMSRNATLTYKDKPTDTRQVGKDLNVRYLIEGSVQRADQNVRVTAQLIDASTGSQLWADRYDREISSIFAIRDDITRSIVGTLGGLGGKLAQAEVARLSAKNPNSFTAYDYLMRAGTSGINSPVKAMQPRAIFLNNPGKSTRTMLAPTLASPGPMPTITTTNGRRISKKLLNSHSRSPKQRCALIPMIIKLNGHLGGHVYITGNTSGRWPITCARESSIRTMRSYSRKWQISSSGSASRSKQSIK